ncbi:MAG: addiction module protein [Planctomycetaceae bacterium]|nr:addiction module protein [Planctomycetaceae bacterium]
MQTIDEILDAARLLNPADRLRLVATLWEETPPSDWPLPSAAWIAEVQRRSAEIDQGLTNLTSNAKNTA